MGALCHGSTLPPPPPALQVQPILCSPTAHHRSLPLARDPILLDSPEINELNPLRIYEVSGAETVELTAIRIQKKVEIDK